MDLEKFIRPVICTTGYEECQAAFFGSGFLLRSASEFYFVTAGHILTNHGKKISDIRIPNKLGSHEIIPQLRGINANIGGNHSFEDLLVIHLDGGHVHQHKLEDQFWLLRDRDCQPIVGQRAIAVGFPEEEQEVDIENNKGSYCPIYVHGKISEIDPEEQMIAVATLPTTPLASFNQMSGGAVFAFDQNDPNKVALVGVILQGGRTANVIRPLGSRCILNLINYFERDNREQVGSLNST